MLTITRYVNPETLVNNYSNNGWSEGIRAALVSLGYWAMINDNVLTDGKGWKLGKYPSQHNRSAFVGGILCELTGAKLSITKHGFLLKVTIYGYAWDGSDTRKVNRVIDGERL